MPPVRSVKDKFSAPKNGYSKERSMAYFKLAKSYY